MVALVHYYIELTEIRSVTETSILVPLRLNHQGLSEVVNHLLGSGKLLLIYIFCKRLFRYEFFGAIEKPVPFDFEHLETHFLVRSSLKR